MMQYCCGDNFLRLWSQLSLSPLFSVSYLSPFPLPWLISPSPPPIPPPTSLFSVSSLFPPPSPLFFLYPLDSTKPSQLVFVRYGIRLVKEGCRTSSAASKQKLPRSGFRSHNFQRRNSKGQVNFWLVDELHVLVMDLCVFSPVQVLVRFNLACSGALASLLNT